MKNLVEQLRALVRLADETPTKRGVQVIASRKMDAILAQLLSEDSQ